MTIGEAWVRIGRACEDGGADEAAVFLVLKEFYRFQRSDRLLTESFNLDTPWPLPDVLDVLVEAADHLLKDHDCDKHGYERVMAARDAAKQISARFIR